jgi:hypothetical protein
MNKGRKLATTIALCAAALAVPGSAMASPAGGGLAPAVRTHATNGCNGAVVQTPRAGSELTARSLGLPAAADAFYAEAARHHVRWLSAMTCIRHNLSHALVPAGHSGASQARTANALESSNWSGYQINQTAQYVQAGWTVPAVVTPKPGYSTTGYDSSSWAGLGGGFNSGSGALIQAGTEQDLSASGVASYYFWYEIVGGTGDTRGSVQVPLAVHPGNVVGAVALWTPAGGAEMGDCNFTTGTCLSYSLASSAPGTSEEWIVEAPSQYGFILPLADFGSVTFINACWATTYVKGAQCYTISAGGPTPIYLYSYVLRSEQELAGPRPLNSTGNGFTDYYYQPARNVCPSC